MLNLFCMEETKAYINYQKKTKVMKTFATAVGGIMTAVAVVALLVGLIFFAGSDGFMVGLYVIFGALIVVIGLCLPLLLAAKKRKDILDLYVAYSRVLRHNPHNAVSEIVESRGAKKEDVINNFVMLNSLGFFDEIFIDEKEFVVNSGHDEKPSHEFKCPKCEGVTAIEDGKENVCAFCGTIKEDENEKEEN